MRRRRDRDVTRFDRWAPTYDQDRLQDRFFRPVQAQTLSVVARLGFQPLRVLDIGCGTGALLRLMAGRYPGAELVGIDAAAGMISTAKSEGGVPALVSAVAEALPFADSAFDLVTSTVSFHHWSDQIGGLTEIRRVLAADGVLVLVDLHAVSYLRAFYALTRRRGRMHTRREVAVMLTSARLQVREWAPTRPCRQGPCACGGVFGTVAAYL